MDNQNSNQKSNPPFEGGVKDKKSAIAGKHGLAYSTARHLARLGMQKVIKQSPEMKKYTKEDFSDLEEAKATPCGRCGTTHVPPSQGGTCPALKNEEEIVELSKSTLASYAMKAADQARNKKDAAIGHVRKFKGLTSSGEIEKSTKADQRISGVKSAISRLAKEDVEHVDELSNELLQRYKKEAGKQVDDPSTSSSMKYKRGKGHLLATVKQMKSGKPMPPIQKEETTMKTFQTLRSEIQEKTLTAAEMKKREEVAKAIERENPNMPMGKKMAIATATAKKVAEQAESIEETHYCAKHVYSDLFGEGLVVEGEHADPAEDGSIEWYNVKFDHGVEKVFTEDVKIMFAEYHMNHKRKKKKMMEQDVEEKALHPNQQVLDVHEPEKDKLTSKDFEMLRKIKKNRTK